MFNLECQEQSGIVIGACVDRFLFGACCHIPENLRTTTETESLSSLPALPTPSSLVSAVVNNSANVISLISETFPTAASSKDQKLQFSTSSSSSSSSSSRNPPSTAATFSHINKNANVSFSPSSLPASTSTIRPISSTSKDYSTRFPLRHSTNPLGSGDNSSPPRRVPSHGTQHETLGTLNPSSYVLPNRERTTLPSTRDIVTLLPQPLETFSSFSDSIADSPNRGDNPVHHSYGQSHDTMEHETLGYHNRMKPRPSSTRLQMRQPNPSSSNLNNLLDSTEEPPKISTFMYVDDKDQSNNNNLRLKNKLSLYTSTTTSDGAVEEKTVPFYNEDLNSNTENIWSVVMQLGSQNNNNNGGGGNNEVSPSSSPIDSEMSKLDDLSLLADQSSSSDTFPEDLIMPTVGGLILDNSFLNLKTESAIPTTTTNKIGDENDATTELDSENENLFKTTTKPWASSTYFVHTFTYPNFTDTTIDDSEEDNNNDAFDKKTNPVPSSTIPSIGKITTWSGIGSVVDKEHLINRHPDSSEEGEIINNNKPLTTTLLLTRSTTTKPSPSTTTRQTTTKKHYSTRRTTTSTSTTTEMPETNKRPVTTEKWKKPKPYTLPPHKRPTTPEPSTPKTEPTPWRTTTTTKKPSKIITRAPPQLKEKVDKKPVAPSIILDEEMDTNLDDFVEQVVQGIAGTLDNLNIDDVILPQVNEASADPTINPLQVISDPLFPPFPVVKDGALTKPTKMTNIQQNDIKEVKTATTTTKTTTTTQKPLDWRKDCGVRTLQKSGRIVGGTASKFGRWPWQALVKEATWLGLFSKNKCGGVLITPKYVLTAAHCQPGFLATLTVVLGDFDISSNSENQANSITKNVRRVIVHRDYNAQTFENDIALLELDSAVDFQSHIVPICLPNDEEEFIGRKAYVTGWGRLKYGGGVPQILHEVDVPILKNDECQDMFHKSGHLKAIRDSFICAGYAEGFKDSCEGDSGGPLSIQRSTGQWVLAGTVSHGIKCAYPNLPGVYMRMTFYKPWIKRVTGVK